MAGMNDHDQLAGLLRRHFAEAADPRPPAGQLASVRARIADTAQRHAWRPSLVGPWEADRTGLGRGWLLLALAFVIAVSAVGLVLTGAGARLLHEALPPTEPLPAVSPSRATGPTGLVVYAVNGSIHTLDPVSGQDRTVLVQPGVESSWATWSRDGKRILAQVDTSSVSLAPDGSDLVTIPAFGRGDWSPTASRYAVVEYGDPSSLEAPRPSVGLWDAHDHSRITVPWSLPGIEELAWSPDGTSLLAVGCDAYPCRHSTDHYSLWAMSVSDRIWHLVLAPGEMIFDARWAPDGRRVAFYTDCASASRCQGVEVVDADGGGLTDLTPNDPTASDPVWSPDGQRLAFESSRDGVIHIYTMRPDGTDVVQVTRGPLGDVLPVWSSDGGWIAFAREQVPNGRTTDIWTVRADGSNERKIVGGTNNFDWQHLGQPTVQPSAPSLSPTGASGAIAFSASDGGARSVWRFDGDPWRQADLHESRAGESGSHLTGGPKT
jgi:Tol biopolymer transport system component